MMLISTGISVGILSLALYYLQAWFARSAFARQHGCQLPPKRRTPNFFFGVYSQIQASKSTKAFNSLPKGATLHRKYGPTYRESSWFSTTLKTSDAANVQVIYGSKAKDYGVQPLRLVAMRPFCGEGMLTTDGSTWERSRTMIRPSFHKSNISELSAFERSVKHLILRIPRDGSTVDFQSLISLMFVDTSSQFLLGQSLGVLDGDVLEESPVDGKTFLRAWQLSLRSCSIRNSLGIFKFVMSKSETVDQWQIVHKFIEFHIDRALQDTSRKTEERHRSLLENLLQRTNDKVDVRDHIIQGMMAAQDTTSILISNTIFLLSRDPTVWERLRAEVAPISSDPLTAEDTRKYKLLHNILHESLRLYPIFPVLARVALNDSILPVGGGPRGDQPVFAPAGTKILVDFYTLHRDETVYGEDVEEFKPDRWDSIKPGPWQFMAFGGGQRACLGQQKALTEASYTLIKLARAFKRVESRDDREWAGDQKLTARNAHGCKIALIPS